MSSSAPPLLKLDQLEKEYMALVQQYTASNARLTQLLADKTNPTFVSIPGRSWWGTGGVAEQTVDSQQACEDLCKAAPACSGATFNPDSLYCWIRSGNNPLVANPAGNTNVALLSEVKATLITLAQLNRRLMEKNRTMALHLKSVSAETVSPSCIDDKKREMEQTYTTLHSDSQELEGLYAQMFSVNQAYETQQLYVERTNMTFRLWTLIALLLLLVCLRIFTSVLSAPAMIVGIGGIAAWFLFDVPVVSLGILFILFVVVKTFIGT